MARTIGREGGKIKVAIADDSGLIFSDDYRQGWQRGFELAGCEVRSFDIKVLRKIGAGSLSHYRSTAMPGTAKSLADQVVGWQPDLVWCHHGRAASNQEFLARIHRSGIKTAVYLCDEPYETGETARYSQFFRYVFTMDWMTVEAHRLSRADRTNVYYLPPGVQVEHFQYKNYKERKVSAFFLGNASLEPRVKWLKPVERLVDGADIRFFKPTNKRDSRWVSVEDHPALYSSCIVGLNVHRDPSITMECFNKRVLRRPKHLTVPKGLELCREMPQQEGTGFWNDGNLRASHVNPRFMEMASCGTCVVSDSYRSELARMFPMAPRAEDPQHFVELVLYYLKHKDEAEKIGESCSYLISRRHSYTHRAAEVLIRVGLKGLEGEDLPTYLGEPKDWLTQQDLSLLSIRSSSDPIGPSERWSPQYGMSLISESGSPSEADSLDAPSPWLS